MEAELMNKLLLCLNPVGIGAGAGGVAVDLKGASEMSPTWSTTSHLEARKLQYLYMSY